MSVDTELLNRDPYENSNTDPYNNPLEDKSVSQEQEGPSLREQVYTEKVKKKKEADKKKKESLVSKLNPIKKWSAEALKQSWLNIIPSFGLSVFGVFGIAFLRVIFGKNMIVRLGDEWTVAGIGQFDEKKKKMLNIVEPIGLVLIILIILLVTISIIALIAMIAGFIDNPLKAIKTILVDVFEKWLNIK